MPNIPQPDKKWFHVLALIAGIDATPTQKYLLTLVLRHTHSRKGFAWANQETLAAEMCVDVSTVERAFRWAKGSGIVGVRRIRTGKGKAAQYNEYWVNVERLGELQRRAKHPAPVTGAPSEQPAPMKGANDGKHPAPVPPSTPHLTPEHPAFSGRAPRTHAGEGLEVKQVESNSGKETSSSETAATKTDDDVHILEKEKIDKLYRDHPRFVELCCRIVLGRAEEMKKSIASPARYVRAALPSLLKEPDLLTQISFTLGDDFKDAWPLYEAATTSFFSEPQSKPIEYEVQAEIREIHRQFGRGSKELERTRVEQITQKIRNARRTEPKYVTPEYGPPGERPTAQDLTARLALHDRCNPRHRRK